MYDVAIVGAGVIGCFVARELARYAVRVAVIERENDVACGSTKANSGILYDGFHSDSKKLKGRLIMRGLSLYETLCRELDIPVRQVGSLTLGFDETDLETIRKHYQKAQKRHVPGVSILEQDDILRLEPLVNPAVRFALYSKGCSVVAPYEIAIALAENAVRNGVDFFFNSSVSAIRKHGDAFVLTAGEQTIRANYVINCAGVHADAVSDLISPEREVQTILKRGEYGVFDKSTGGLFHTVISCCKREKKKGILLIPTIHGNLMAGPGLEEVEDGDDARTTAGTMERIRRQSRDITGALPVHKIIKTFSGVYAKTEEGDFILRESTAQPGFVNVAAINIPGLTCAPAIAERVVAICAAMFERDGKMMALRPDFEPQRKGIARIRELDETARAALVRRNPLYGHVICQCEGITEGEIVDSIHRKPGAVSVSGVKKRTGATMGRCQSGFCLPKITGILAHELRRPQEDILLDQEGSQILYP